MSTESIELATWEDRLRRSLERHQVPVTSRQLMEILADAAEPTPPVTLADREFLIEHGGLTEADLTPEALAAVDVGIAASRSLVDRDVQADSLSTQQVAEMLDMAPANVRRAAADTLYSVKTSVGGHHWFPKWQFPHRRQLPGLREVIHALPRHYHPLEVESFMTERGEVLGGRSPVEWLAGGGEVSEVVAMADERAWE